MMILLKKLRIIQSKKISKSMEYCSFSSVINDELRKTLKYRNNSWANYHFVLDVGRLEPQIVHWSVLIVRRNNKWFAVFVKKGWVFLRDWQKLMEKDVMHLAWSRWRKNGGRKKVLIVINKKLSHPEGFLGEIIHMSELPLCTRCKKIRTSNPSLICSDCQENNN